MPGIIIVQNKIDKLDIKLDDLSNLAYTEEYQQEIIFENDTFTVFKNGYKSYPIEILEDSKYLLILEGYIYNQEHNEFMKKLRKQYSDFAKIDSNFLSNYLSVIDGDFIFYLIDKLNEKIIIFNDQLKRLPLYYFQNEQCFICARDLKFITSNIDLIINKDALIDYLLFMIPTGNETLHKDLYKLDCASILCSSKNEFNLSIYKLWNYEKQTYKAFSFKKSQKELTEILFEGMKNRVFKIEGEKVNVLLSGGLDSRTIIAMLEKITKNTTAQTFLYSDKSNIQDYEKSYEIAQLAGFDWNSYEIEEISKTNIRELINLKSAMNYGGIANILSFLKNISKPNQQFYTGDGGRILKNDFPRERISSMKELVNYAISHKILFEPAKIAIILNISEDLVYKRIKDMFSNFPESSMKYKYLHFLYHERTLNWLQEGEDRNRKYFWSATPFSNYLLYDYAKNINPKFKKSFKLYKKILENFSPKYLNITYNDIDDLKSIRYQFSDKMKLFIGYFPRLKKRLMKLKKTEKLFFVKSEQFLTGFVTVNNNKIFNNFENMKLTKAEVYTLATLLEYFK